MQLKPVDPSSPSSSAISSLNSSNINNTNKNANTGNATNSTTHYIPSAPSGGNKINSISKNRPHTARSLKSSDFNSNGDPSNKQTNNRPRPPSAPSVRFQRVNDEDSRNIRIHSASTKIKDNKPYLSNQSQAEEHRLLGIAASRFDLPAQCNESVDDDLTYPGVYINRINPNSRPPSPKAVAYDTTNFKIAEIYNNFMDKNSGVTGYNNTSSEMGGGGGDGGGGGGGGSSSPRSHLLKYHSIGQPDGGPTAINNALRPTSANNANNTYRYTQKLKSNPIAKKKQTKLYDNSPRMNHELQYLVQETFTSKDAIRSSNNFFFLKPSSIRVK